MIIASDSSSGSSVRSSTTSTTRLKPILAVRLKIPLNFEPYQLQIGKSPTKGGLWAGDF